MRTLRVFSETLIEGLGEHHLDAAASHHLGTVLRAKQGTPVTTFDGRGGEYQGTISQVSKKAVCLTLTHYCADDQESPLCTQLGIGISRNDRMDWVLQKATELGVNRITPILTERSEFRLKGERQDKKYNHWQAIVRSACEQSGRNRVPLIDEPLQLDEFIKQCSADLKLVLYPHSEKSLQTYQRPSSIALLIGPEGGLSDEEIQQAMQCDFQALRLGPRVLRTETAPLAALAILQYQWGDLC